MKKIIVIGLTIVIFGVIVFFLSSMFVNSQTKKAYDKGFLDGNYSVWAKLSEQFGKTGRLELPATDDKGNTGFIIFNPQPVSQEAND